MLTVLALAGIAHADPRPAGPSVAKHRQGQDAKPKNVDYIGSAKMLRDGTLVLDLRAETPNGAIGHSQATYAVGDPHYVEVLRHIGGLKPGGDKPVPAWPDMAIPLKDLSTWNACRDAASESDEASNAEEMGGKMGYHEFLVNKCGPRPVVQMNGKIALFYEDCATLYDWIEDGLCMPEELSTNQRLIADQLDHRIFNSQKFSDKCKARHEKNIREDFSSFRKQMCESVVNP